MNRHSADEAIVALREVVRGWEGHTARCHYISQDSTADHLIPECIVGQVFDKWGQLSRCTQEMGTDEYGDPYEFDPNLADLEESVDGATLAPSLTEGAVLVLKAAQGVQDGWEGFNRTWGDALEAAERTYRQLAKEI